MSDNKIRMNNEKFEELYKEYGGRSISIEETYSQLMVKKQIVWCWGAHGFGLIKDKAVIFKVNGFLLKGSVMIFLHGSDTYSIVFLDEEKNIYGEVKTGIYCDQLVDVIDSVVETL